MVLQYSNSGKSIKNNGNSFCNFVDHWIFPYKYLVGHLIFGTEILILLPMSSGSSIVHSCRIPQFKRL